MTADGPCDSRETFMECYASMMGKEVEYAVSHESQLWSLAFSSEQATQEITVDCTWREWLNSFVNNERNEVNANTINDDKCKEAMTYRIDTRVAHTLPIRDFKGQLPTQSSKMAAVNIGEVCFY